MFCQCETDQRRIDAILGETIPEIFGYLEGVLESPYLAGSAISIADISVVSNLVTYQYLGFDPHRNRDSRLAA